MKYIFTIQESNNDGFYFLNVYDRQEDRQDHHSLNEDVNYIRDFIMSYYDTYDNIMLEIKTWI